MAQIKLKAFDPSEITLTLKTKDRSFDVYGFSTGNKIWVEDNSLKFKVQAISDSNKEIVPFLNIHNKRSIEVSLNPAEKHSYLEMFSGKQFTLEVDSALICGDQIPTITYKLYRDYK